MEIYYQGTDITPSVTVKNAVIRDTCGERCDSLELEFEYAKNWYGWGVKTDDQIRVTHRGYDSGDMFLHTVLPENGQYRLFATALPCRGRNREYRSFRGMTLREILRQCGMRSSMDQRIYGIDGDAVIPYIQQCGETAAAFLDRLLTMEGAKLKCVNGRYAAIGLQFARERPPVKSMEISAEQSGARFLRSGTRARTLTVQTPFASAAAEDTAAADSLLRVTVSDRPAMTDVQAGRWARGLLTDMNRKTETLTTETVFDPNLCAMIRLDVTGGTDADGEWLVETAIHDLINNTTKAEMHRCIDTVR